VEQHNDNDPRDTDEAWQQVSKSWVDIGDRLKDRYREVVGDAGPSEDQVRDALKTLGTAMQAVFDSLGSAMRDPDVRTQMKEATAGFASAVGQTFSDLGDEIRRANAEDSAEDHDTAPGELPEQPSE
jgi:hypothetical protein